jgi:hypothetical protein
MEIVHDKFNNQFMFHTYIEEFYSDLYYYLDNNNINLNYYCIIAKKVDNTCYIVTSATNKRLDNGYRLITITEMETDHNIKINEGIDTVINLDNLHVQIFARTDLSEINRQVSWLNLRVQDIAGKLPVKGVYNEYAYNKDVLETEFTSAFGLYNLKILPILWNLKKIMFSSSFSQINIGNLYEGLEYIIILERQQLLIKRPMPKSLKRIIIKYIIKPRNLQYLIPKEYHNLVKFVDFRDFKN